MNSSRDSGVGATTLGIPTPLSHGLGTVFGLQESAGLHS